MEYALQLLFSILLGMYAGHWLDQKTGHSPWFTLLGLFCGIFLGMGLLYKRAMASIQKEKDKKQDKDKLS
jgi:F0F1-type ATP synthase assembly protein I